MKSRYIIWRGSLGDVVRLQRLAVRGYVMKYKSDSDRLMSKPPISGLFHLSIDENREFMSDQTPNPFIRQYCRQTTCQMRGTHGHILDDAKPISGRKMHTLPQHLMLLSSGGLSSPNLETNRTTLVFRK